LSIKLEAMPKLADLLAKVNQENLIDGRKAEMLSETALCKQQIQNAEILFMLARIDEETLNRHIEENERSKPDQTNDRDDGLYTRGYRK
jgi:hypothetical protein